MSKSWALLCCVWVAMAQVQPTLRVDVRLVTVDIVVRTDKGPVKGLTKDDFTIQDKGKTQSIDVFAVTDRSANVAAGATLPANVSSNRMTNAGEEARSAIVVLFDRLNIPRPLDQAAVRTKVLAYIASLQPADRIGFYSLGTSLTMVQDFNDDSGPMVQAAKRMISPGQAAPSDARSQELDARLKEALVPIQQQDIRVRTATTGQAMRTIARHLAGIPGRKGLIWVLSDFPLTYGEAADRRTNYTDEIARVTNLMSDANVAVYPMDPRGVTTTSLTTSGAEPTGAREGGLMPGANAASRSAGADVGLSGLETMETIAKATGGIYSHDTNDLGPDVRKVMDDSAVTYTLGFYVDEKKLDGKSHDLSVKLAKKPETNGATVRYKKSYVATNLQAAQQQRPTMAELITDPLNATTIAIMAATAPHPTKPGTHAVQVRVNVADLEFEHKADKWVASFDLGMALESADGKATSVITVPNNLNLTDDQLKQGLASGLVVDSAAPTPAQAGRLRVVVQDKTTGAAGSVRLPIGPN